MEGISKTYKSGLHFDFNERFLEKNDAMTFMLKEAQGIINPNYYWELETSETDKDGNYSGTVEPIYSKKITKQHD